MSFIQSGSNSIANIGTYNDTTNGNVAHSAFIINVIMNTHLSVYNESDSNKLKSRLSTSINTREI